MVNFPFFPELYRNEFLCTLDYLMMNKNVSQFSKKKKTNNETHNTNQIIMY